MPELYVQSNSFQYIGEFASPVLSLWGKGDQILSGLYEAFRSYGITLESLTPLNGTPSEQGISVRLGRGAGFEFKLDRFVLNLTDFVASDLAKVPDMLQSATSWLQRLIPTHSFSSHLCSYSSHSTLSEGTSDNVLRPLSKSPSPNLGQSKANGLIYHYDLKDRMSAHLTVDHSLLVDQGIWLNFYLLVSLPAIDFDKMTLEGQQLLRELLGNAGLTFPDTPSLG